MPATATRADEIAPDDPAKEKEFSERELRKQRQTLTELRETRTELRERLEELEDEIAEVKMSGGDASDLLEEKREIEEEIDWRERAEPKLERRIRARSLRRLERLAKERVQTIQKKLGGLAGEQPRKIERAVEALEEAEARLQAAAESYALGQVLESELQVLAEAFGIEIPETKTVPSPKAFDVIKGAGSVQGWLGWDPTKPLATADRQAAGAGRVGDMEPRKALRRLEGIDVNWDGPSANLIEALEELEKGDDGE